MKTKKSTIFFYVNLLIFLPFLLLALSGLIMQINYHAGHIRGAATVLGLNRHEWLQLHKISAVISIIGISIHIFLHMSWIKIVLLKKSYAKLHRNSKTTIWLFFIFIAVSITGLISWLFPSGAAQGRHGANDLIEIHDKIGIILFMLFILHIINHWTWIIKTFSDIRKNK